MILQAVDKTGVSTPVGVYEFRRVQTNTFVGFSAEKVKTIGFVFHFQFYSLPH
jgi:hypothetical protein